MTDPSKEDEANPDRNRFEYLQGKFIMRFPFTLTSMKWGVALGGFFGLHAFIKTRSFNRAIEWFFWGTILSTFPIWCFFMVKHSFYSHTIRQFENDQIYNIQEAELLKIYLREKLNAPQDDNEEELIERLKKTQQEELHRNAELDFLLWDITPSSFD